MLVFNFPYPENRWNSISMDVMRYYVKRCIALPGDTLEIRGGRYKVRGCGERLGNQDERYIEKLEHAEQYGIAVDAFPYDEQQGWTVCEFGPLAIPEKGRKVVMNRTNFFLYRQLIDWEQKKKLSLKDGRILLGIVRLHSIVLKKTIILLLVTIWQIRRIRVIGGCYRKSIL